MRFLVETLLLMALRGVFKVLPRRAALSLGRTIGRGGYLIARQRRALAIDNLRLSLGDKMSDGEIVKTVLTSFESHGMNIADFFKLPDLNRENVALYTSVKGEENLVNALALGHGVLTLSSHLGSWDMLSAGLALRGYPVSLITKVSRSEALNRIWMDYRKKAGIELIMGRGTMKETLRQLKKGGMVGFALDQNARRKEGVFVPFFGREACTLTSLALMARRTGAPVVLIYTYRDGDLHRIVIEKPIFHDSIEDSEADILMRTRMYTSLIEKIIRLHPEQWTWLHDRWKTRPRDESRVQSPESGG